MIWWCCAGCAVMPRPQLWLTEVLRGSQEVAGREAHASTQRRRYCRNAGRKMFKIRMGESFARAKPSYVVLEGRIDGLVMSFDESVVTRC